MAYGSIIKGMNKESVIGRYWNPLSLIRWALTNLIMVFLRQHCVFQIFILLMISAFFQGLIIIANPIYDK
jgi:sugar phosphate permease